LEEDEDVYKTNNTLRFALLCVAAAGIFCPQPVLSSLPSKFLTGASAAGGLAAINSVGNLGGFIAQNVVLRIRDATGSTIAPMLFLAASSLQNCRDFQPGRPAA
jgi:hypothetical protein